MENPTYEAPAECVTTTPQNSPAAFGFIAAPAVVLGALLFVSGTLSASQPLPFNQAAVKQSTAPAMQGPDASAPYFTVRFALPIPPDNDWHAYGPLLGIDAAVGDHHHSPAFEVMPNGDALFVPFSGSGYREGGRYVRIVQARLRYGAEEFDLPEEIVVQGMRMQDLLGSDGTPAQTTSPLLWREGSTVWLFVGGHQWPSYTQPPADPRPGGFRVFKSTDNGATWTIVALEPKFSGITADKQPIVNAFRAPNGNLFVAADGMNGAGTSLLWRSSDNGLSWIDQGGRTSGRHSTIVPLDTSGTLLSLGGKDTSIRGYMPQNISTDWGVTWGAPTQSPFPWLGGGQRPSLIRLASGNLVMVGDSRHRSNPHTTPSGWSHGDGPYVALSADNGSSWTIKALPVALPAKVSWAHKTIGYATVRQAPNGVIHLLSTITHPCLHYEFNEAWITTPSAGDMQAETTGGTVKSYRETYPGGAPKATWSARVTPGGRYLLDGVAIDYYENGRKQREVTWASGRRDGGETLWAPDGNRIWSWNHDLASNVSTWTHWWPEGRKRLESHWDTNPVARARRADPFFISAPELSGRRFRGMVAHGTARHWNPTGQEVGAYTFLNGVRTSPRGNHTENFNTAPSDRGWTGSGHTAGGNDFGWSSTTWTEAGNSATYPHPKGEIGGVFARSATYRWYADTNIGPRNRTQTLHLSGLWRLRNENSAGTIRIGYFDTLKPESDFIGLEIREPAGTILDPVEHGSGTKFRAYLIVRGSGGTTSRVPMEVYIGGGVQTFDLIWKGNPDGSGTLGGTVSSLPMPTITVASGSGSFDAFGLLAGGDGSSDATKRTAGCHFDNLTYDKHRVTTSNANRATGGNPPPGPTKQDGDAPLRLGERRLPGRVPSHILQFLDPVSSSVTLHTSRDGFSAGFPLAKTNSVWEIDIRDLALPPGWHNVKLQRNSQWEGEPDRHLYLDGEGRIALPPAVYLTWTGDPTTTIVVHWHNDGDDAKTLRHRPAGSNALWTTLEAASTVPFPHTERHVHTVEITGLAPHSDHEFQVDGYDETLRFRTLPARLDAPLKFGVGGDVDIGPTADAMTAAISSHDPAFLVIGGDVAYCDALAENSWKWMRYFESWFHNARAPDGRLIPKVMGIGNHEVHKGYARWHRDYDNSAAWRQRNAPYFYRFFAFPGLTGHGVLDFGNYLSLVMLDTDHSSLITDQIAWLRQTLDARRDRAHLIPVYHVTAYPSARPFDNEVSTRVRQHWVPLFENAGVKLAFEHHDHTFKHTKPLLAGEENAQGISYFGDGLWGINSRQPDARRWYLQPGASSQYHVHLVTLTETDRIVRSVAIDGSFIGGSAPDHILLAQPADGIPSTPSGLESTRVSPRSANLAWQPVGNATHYKIERDGSPVASVSTTTWTDAERDPGSNASYQVIAVNRSGHSPATGALAVATPAE